MAQFLGNPKPVSAIRIMPVPLTFIRPAAPSKKTKGVLQHNLRSSPKGLRVERWRSLGAAETLNHLWINWDVFSATAA
jgi:hypothetical protein